MQINQVVENEDGGANITGSLSGQELEVAVSLGLNMLYAQGLMSQLAPSLLVTEAPGAEVAEEDKQFVLDLHQVHNGPDTSQ